MNLKRIKTTVAAGVLAASMILPNMTAFAANPIQSVDGIPVVAESNNQAIKKIVKSTDGTTYTRTFHYTFKQGEKRTDDAVGIEVDQYAVAIPQVDVSATSDNAAYAENKTSGDKTETITANIVLPKYENPGVYTYTITETDESESKDGTTWVYDDAAYTLRVYVQKQDDGSLVKNMTIVNNEDGSAKTDKAEFTNTITKESFVDITKSATDESGLEPAGTEYTFNVTISTTDLTKDKSTYTYTIYKDGQAVGTATAFNGTIKLTSGQTARINGVPAGATVTVEEVSNPANVDKTAISYKVGENGTDTNVSQESVTKVENVLVDETGSFITYSNTWKNVTVTGVVTNIAPYVTLVVVAVAAIAAYVAMKKRIAR